MIVLLHAFGLVLLQELRENLPLARDSKSAGRHPSTFRHCTTCIFLAESNIDKNNITSWLKTVVTRKEDKSSTERVNRHV